MSHNYNSSGEVDRKGGVLLQRQKVGQNGMDALGHFHLHSFDINITRSILSTFPDAKKDFEGQNFWNISIRFVWNVNQMKYVQVNIYRPQTKFGER